MNYYFVSFSHARGFGNCYFRTRKKVFTKNIIQSQIPARDVTILYYVKVTKKEFDANQTPNQ